MISETMHFVTLILAAFLIAWGAKIPSVSAYRELPHAQQMVTDCVVVALITFALLLVSWS